MHSCLQNYWPFFWGTNDMVGTADMKPGANVKLCPDRDNKENSAACFDHGYTTLPPGVYFGANYTTMAWVKMREYGRLTRLLETGTRYYEEQMLFLLSNAKRAVQNSYHETNGSWYINYTPGHLHGILELNEWHHVAWTKSGRKARTYIDGVLVGHITLDENHEVKSVVREKNFIGRSSWHEYGDQDLHADIDELKIFDCALDEAAVKMEMNNEIEHDFQRPQTTKLSITPHLK
jgi:hypothetical protein